MRFQVVQVSRPLARARQLLLPLKALRPAAAPSNRFAPRVSRLAFFSFSYSLLRAYCLSRLEIPIHCVNDEFTKHALKTSHFEFMYVSFLETQIPDVIHAFNTPPPLPRFNKSVPDAYSAERKTLYYAHGCLIHGHNVADDGSFKGCDLLPTFATAESRNPFGSTYRELEQRFEKMIQKIKTTYNVHVEVYYECQFYRDLHDVSTPIGRYYNGPESRHSLLDLTKVEPMVLRDMVRGGTVENYAHFCEVVSRDAKVWQPPSKVISYYDVGSLYPHIGITQSFPCGPGIHLKGRQQLSKLVLDPEEGCWKYDGLRCDGVAQVTIGVARNNTEMGQCPFLPFRMHQKSFRAFCYQCVVELRNDLCPHSFEERCWTSTYTLSELAFAIHDLKYTLVRLHESLLYTHLVPMFSDFFKLCAMTKIRYDKVPARLEHDLPSYCAEINKGLSLSGPFALTPELISPNPTMRTYVKGLMNHCLGKFLQSQTKSVCTFVKSQDHLTSLFLNPAIDITDCMLLNNDTMQVTYSPKEKLLKRNRNTQIVIGGLVTSHARIHLHKLVRSLQQSQCEILYTDTVSS